MPSEPIILLTFANDEDAHLEMLKAESHAVYDALEDVDNNGIVEVKREESVTLDIIVDRLNKYQNDICIFHYSGHASGQHLELEGTTANADGLAKLIAAAPNIQLVVLNGCASFGQVELLLELGIKAVIATTTAIGDTKAKEFSEQFYSALGEYKTLNQAFNQAIAYLETKYAKFEAQVTKPKKGLKLKRKKSKDQKEGLPWGLYQNDDTVLEWKLNQDLKFKSKLLQGSKNYYEKLWNNRFETLEIADSILPNFESKLKIHDAFAKEDFALDAYRKTALNKPEHHLSILGGIGSGKTVILLKEWKTILSNTNWTNPIPIYVDLSSYNRTSNLEDYILSFISIHYLGKKRPSDNDINLIWNVLKNPIKAEPFTPSILLMIDGISEIVVEHIGLINEIKTIVTEALGTQVIMTSSNDFVFTWMKQFHKIQTTDLTEDQVKAYLDSLEIPIPPASNKRLRQFITTPLTLTLYGTSSSLVNTYQSDKRLNFRGDVNTYSELAWNSTEAIIAKISKEFENKEFNYIKFMIRHFLPFIGNFMEAKDKYILTEGEMAEAVLKASEYLFQKKFLKAFPEYIFSFRNFKLQAKDWLEELERLDYQIQFMNKNLKILSTDERGGERVFHFAESHHRSFFSAVHIFNDIKVSLQQNELPISLSQRKLSAYNSVSLQVGELLGEYKNTSEALTHKRTWSCVEPTILNDVLNLCRKKFNDEAAKNVTWNILTIWKKVRKHFADTDLTHLDLRDFIFDEFPLRHFRRYPIHPTQIRNSLVNSRNFISQGHTKGINSVTYSPDGKKILSASIDNKIKEWSTSTGTCLQTLIGHSETVTVVQYSPDGKKAYSGSNDGVIIEWDIETGKPERTFEDHESGISDIKYIPNEKQIISASLDKTVKIWSLKQNECIQTFSNFNAPIIKIALHPYGHRFMFSTRENSFQEWSIEKDESTQLFIGHAMPVESIEYTCDGKNVISSSYDSSIKIWNPETGECIETLTGHIGPIIGLKTSPTKPEEILTCGRDNMVKGWNLSNGECIFSLDLTGAACLDIHPSGTRFIAGSWDSMIKEWNYKGSKLNVFEGYSNQVTAIDCSKDGHYLISGSSDNNIRQWDLTTGICIQTIKGHTQNINNLAFSKSGKFILSASDDCTIKLWLSTTGQCFRTFEGHENVIKSICFHPNDRKFISSSYDKTIKEWDVRSGKCLKTFSSEKSFDVANKAIYSPDLTKVYSAHNDSKIRVWDAETGEFLKEFGNEDAQHSLMVYSIIISSDSKFLVSSSEDSTIKIWDLETEKCLQTLEGHSQPVESICFNEKGSRVLSASRDKTVREWDLETGVCRQILEGHFDAVTDVLYHPKMPFIYSSSLDNTIKKWNVHGIEDVVSKEKLGDQLGKIQSDKEKLDDKKELLKEKAKEEKSGSLFDSFAKLTGILTDTVKKVVINQKDSSIETLYSASGLHLQGADFRNLHEESNFSNKSKTLLRQYGAIFDNKDKENWEELVKQLKAYKMD